jgi:putative transcriptional regulator
MTTSHSAPKPSHATETDWSAFDAMSDEEVIARAETDADNPPLTKAQRAQLKPVAHVTRVRWSLRLTQEQFAERFGIPLGTLRDWEQQKVVPDAAAQVLLRVIALNPDLVATAARAA